MTTLQQRAKRSVMETVRSGRLVRPFECEECGKEHLHIHAHHEDYMRRLDVMWLCPSCHMLRHQGL